MNDTAAATDTAQTTVEEALTAQGRTDVLNEFARIALGQAQPEAGADGEGDEPEAAEAKAGAAEGADADAKQDSQDDLSQSNAEEQEVAESKVEGQDDDELKGKLDEHTQQRVNKRIAKEVAKTKAEREQREAAEAQIAELRQQLEQRAQPEQTAPVRNPNNPLSHVTSAQALEMERMKAEQAQDQAEEMLETLQDSPEQVEAALRAAKVDLKDETGVEDYSVNRMRQFLRGVRRTASQVVKQAVPERKAYLEQSAVAMTKAQELVPELKDPKSARSVRFQQVVQAYPDLKSQPWWPVAAAVQLVGIETLEARAAKPVEAKAKPPLPVKIPQPKASAPVTPRPKAGSVSNETMQAAIGGDKNARLKVIQSLVPKFS